MAACIDSNFRVRDREIIHNSSSKSAAFPFKLVV